MAKYLALSIAVALLELYLLLALGTWIGALPTLALVVATALVGSALMKSEGLRMVRSWQQALVDGVVPEAGVLDGMLVVAGGVLLMVPGVLTDVVGLALLFPPARRAIATRVRRRFERGLGAAQAHIEVVSIGAAAAEHFVRDREAIDVEGELVEDDASARRDAPRLGRGSR